MRADFSQIEHLAKDAIQAAPGDLAEFGVWRGTTFRPLACLAREHHRTCHAIDSFVGMAEPSPLDFEFDGTCKYAFGDLSAGGSAMFRLLVSDLPNVVIHEGFIPAILNACYTRNGFCFAHVDLDHFGPTLTTLEWLWPKMRAGGLIVCHDWFPGSVRLATGAIREWIGKTNIKPAGESIETRYVWFRKA